MYGISFSFSGGSSSKRPSAVTETSSPAMTSGNESEAPVVTGCTPQNGENKPPQAIVKPQVLTHVIEGFVIQEGAEPFPVCVSALPQVALARKRNKQPRDATRCSVYMPAGSCQQANTNPLLLLVVTTHSVSLNHSLIMGHGSLFVTKYRWVEVNTSNKQHIYFLWRCEESFSLKWCTSVSGLGLALINLWISFKVSKLWTKRWRRHFVCLLLDGWCKCFDHKDGTLHRMHLFTKTSSNVNISKLKKKKKCQCFSVDIFFSSKKYFACKVWHVKLENLFLLFLSHQ